MMRTRLAGTVAVTAAMAASVALLGDCSKKRFTEPYALAGGKKIDVATLNDGREAYLLYCAGCHGANGEGHGSAAPGMRPPPRAFTQAMFKFGGVGSGSLPTDEALLRTIRRGLHETPMLAWDIPEVERSRLVAYLKTFSPRWKEEEPGEPIAVSPDPWKGREAEAIAKGRVVYHVAGAGNAGCGSCHPSYATRKEIDAMTVAATGDHVAGFVDDPFHATARETQYGIVFDDAGEVAQAAMQLPPDFLINPLKTVFDVGNLVEGAPYTREQQREDIYRVIASGVNGAAMPQWKGALPEENLWALAYYVQSLVELRGTAKGLELKQKLEADPQWTPPAEAPDAGK